MGKSLKFDRVVDLDYLSAYEVIEKLVERFGVEDVQNALNEIAAQQSVQPTELCAGHPEGSIANEGVCQTCGLRIPLIG